MKTLKDAKRLEKTMSDLTCDLKEHKHHASHLCNEMLNTVTRLTPAVELDYEIKYNRERELLRYSIMGGVQQSVKPQYKKLIKRKKRAGQKELDDLSEEEEEKSEGEDPIPEVDELRSSQKESMMTSSKNSDTSEEKEDSFIEKEVPE